MNRSLRSHRDDRGVVALEFVLVLPCFLMLIFGIVVMGNLLRQKTQTSGFARDGARTAVLKPYALPPDTTDTTYSFVGTNRCSDPIDTTKSVTVQATQNVSLRSIPFLPDFLPATITESVTMRCGG